MEDWQGVERLRCGALLRSEPRRLGQSFEGRPGGGGGKLESWGNAEEAEGVAADDLPEVGWRGTEGFEEAPSVAWKIEGKVTGVGRSHAGEGEILQKHSELLVVGGLILRRWRCG